MTRNVLNSLCVVPNVCITGQPIDTEKTQEDSTDMGKDDQGKGTNVFSAAAIILELNCAVQ